MEEFDDEIDLNLPLPELADSISIWYDRSSALWEDIRCQNDKYGIYQVKGWTSFLNIESFDESLCKLRALPTVKKGVWN